MDYIIILLWITLSMVILFVVIESVLIKMHSKKLDELYQLEKETNEYLKGFDKNCEMIQEIEKDMKKTIEQTSELVGRISPDLQKDTFNDDLFKELWSDKLAVAGRMGIAVNVSIEENWDFSDKEKSSLIGNLFDNAVDACQRLIDGGDETTFIDFSIKKAIYEASNREMWLIEVLNSKRTEEHPIKNNFASSKGDKERHGYGTVIIKELVEANQGKILFEDREKAFFVQIWLNQ